MDSAETPEMSARRWAREMTARRRPRALRKFIRSRSAALALAAGLLLGFAATGFAAGLLGGSQGVSLPNLAPLPSPGTGSIPAPDSGSGLDTGTILGPSLGIPLSSPTLSPLNDPLASLPAIGSDLPLGVSPDLKDLSNNVRQSVQAAGNAGRPIRNGFVLPAAGERRL